VRSSSGVSEKLDGNRYRAVGNAVCVNVVSWIARRLLDVDQQWQAEAKLKSS
jgi:hypothetical protein